MEKLGRAWVKSDDTKYIHLVQESVVNTTTIFAYVVCSGVDGEQKWGVCDNKMDFGLHPIFRSVPPS